MDDDLFVHFQRSSPATRVAPGAAQASTNGGTLKTTQRLEREARRKRQKNKSKEKRDAGTAATVSVTASGAATEQPSYITQRFQPSTVAREKKEKPLRDASESAPRREPKLPELSSSEPAATTKKVKKRTKRMRDKETTRAAGTTTKTTGAATTNPKHTEGHPSKELEGYQPPLKGRPAMGATPRLVDAMNIGTTYDEFGSGDAVTTFSKKRPLQDHTSMATHDEFGSGDGVSQTKRAKKRRHEAILEEAGAHGRGSENTAARAQVSSATVCSGNDAGTEDEGRDTRRLHSDTSKEAKDGEGAISSKKWHGRGSDKTAPKVSTTAGPAVRITSAEDVFSSHSFESVDGLEPRLIQQLTYRGFTTMTDVQSKALPATLGGKDALIKAPTGSGKTLSFLVPMISRLVTAGKTDRSNGTMVLVLSPTKELCHQSHQVCVQLTTMLPWLVSCQVSGGENPKSEKARLRKGVHILFATPGRIAYHMEHSAGWKVATNMSCFIMDEADRLLDLGFEKTVKQIHEKIVKPRGAQTVLVSATLTEAVKKLGTFCLKEDHEFVGGKGEESDQWTIPASLKQWCVEFPAKQRLQGLISVLLQKKGKSIVFFSSCAEVDFHYDLFQEMRWPDLTSKKDWKPEVRTINYGKGFIGVDNRNEQDIDVEEETSDRPRVFSSLKVFKLHGDLKAEERNGFIADFSKASNAVLLASDVVARGIDLPCLNWIIQYDPPRQIEEYLHRVGRAARMGRAGDSCLFLQPHEMKYSDVLKEKGVVMKTIDSTALRDSLREHLPNHDPLLKVRDLSAFLGSSITKHVEARPLLLQVARKAFSSWMRGYQTFPRDLKPIFNYKLLHAGHVAASFALQEAPTKVFHTLRKEALEPQDKGKGKGRRDMKKANFKKHSFVDEFAT